ncbi:MULTISPECIES: hypothetical protein [Streptomyces]|nr:hypothetical protein [Streptomyces durhamensis]
MTFSTELLPDVKTHLDGSRRGCSGAIEPVAEPSSHRLAGRV